MAVCPLGDNDDDGLLKHSTQKSFQAQETFDVTVQLRILVLTKLGGCLS